MRAWTSVACGVAALAAWNVAGAEAASQSPTLTDALAIFEVLSDDTATTDRVDKLIDYAAVPSLRAYVLLEQTAVAATVFLREPGGVWIASAHTDGVLALPGLDLALPLADLYRGLSFPA